MAALKTRTHSRFVSQTAAGAVDQDHALLGLGDVLRRQVFTLLGPLASLGARFERRLLAGIALMQVLVVMPALSWWWDDRYAVITVVIAALEGALLAPWLIRSLRSVKRAMLSGRAASAGP